MRVTIENTINSVVVWWAFRISTGRQFDENTENPLAFNKSGNWYGKVSTNTLYEDYVKYCESIDVTPAKKVSAMSHLYHVTGSVRSRSRLGLKGKAGYIALFKSLTWHREHLHNAISNGMVSGHADSEETTLDTVS